MRVIKANAIDNNILLFIYFIISENKYINILLIIKNELIT